MPGLGCGCIAMRRRAKSETEPVTGAPAALERVAREELEAAQAVEDARKRVGMASDEDVAARLRAEHQDALDRWYKAVKALRELDKSVVIERRTEDVVPVREARDAMTQALLSVRLAGEAALLASAQDAALCECEAEFIERAGPRVRDAFGEAIETARRNGALPAWVG
jgi:hypothetical protein